MVFIHWHLTTRTAFQALLACLATLLHFPVPPHVGLYRPSIDDRHTSNNLLIAAGRDCQFPTHPPFLFRRFTLHVPGILLGSQLNWATNGNIVAKNAFKLEKWTKFVSAMYGSEK